MGGLLHFLDFNHGGKSRKSMQHKRCIHGTVAPRNSMELPSDKSLGYQHIYENIPFSVQEKHHLEPNLHLCGAPMKRLIDEEVTKQAKSSHIGAPSVVARLMGMDALPSEAKSSADSKGKTNGSMRNDVPRKTHTNLYYRQYKAIASLPTGPRRDEPPSRIKSNSTAFNQQSKSKRPKPREHPQEEILQQFKKEFEEWQTKKMWEQTNAVGLREKQSYAPQAASMKEKVEKHRDAKWKPTNYNSTAILDENITGENSCHDGPMHEPCQTYPTETMPLQHQSRPADSEYFMKSMEKSENPSSPTRIVVIRPDAEKFGDIDDLWPSSSANAVKKELSMEEFLEEVRNRLRMEINGKSRSIPRGSAVNVNSTKILCRPRREVQNMARQIRESVDGDAYTKLTTSESTRLYESDIQHGGSDSPDFGGDTRAILTEGLNNTSRNEEDAVATSSRAASGGTKLPTKEGNKSRSWANGNRIEGKVVYWEDNHSSLSDKTRSFREEGEIGRPISTEVSPGNLVRSLSAPSGTAFGKLLSEEQHVLIGAHNQRKHEVTDKCSIRSKKNKKNNFDFKSRVSSLRHNLAFKGKLFGGKVHLVDKKDASVSECAKDIETIPSCVVNMGTTQTRPENPTEVPPSPASVSSSPNDDLCKPGHPSPVSPLDVPFIEGNQSPHLSKDIQCDFPRTSDVIRCNIPQTFREISCDSPQHSEMSSDIPPMSKENSCDTNELKPHKIETSEEVEADVNIYKNEIMGVDDHEEACMRDVLTMAGLYRELAQDAILRWGSLPQMLQKWVFEEVQKAFSDKHDKEDSDAPIMNYEVPSVNRKMMFDLVNEALQVIVDPFVNNLGIKRCLPMTTAIPHGKMLVEDVLRQIHNLTHLPNEEDFSPESMAANDVKRAPWIPMMQEVVGEVGTEVVPSILHDLVEEFVLDMYYDCGGNCSWFCLHGL